MKYRKDNDRSQYLGASEAPAVLFGHHSHEEAPVGMPKYLSAFDVWSKKLGNAGAEVDAASTARGHHLEDAVFKWGCEKVGAIEFTRGGDYNSPPVQGPRPWAAFHPDGSLSIAEPRSWADNIVEVKVYRDGKGWDDDAIPAWVAAQVTYQLACCPVYIKGCYIFAYITSRPDDVIARYVERDPAKETAMLDLCEAWWNKHVVANIPPEFDGSDGADSYLLNKHPRQTAPLDDADDAERLTLDELMSVRAKLASLKAEDKRLSQILKDHIGDREGVYVEGIGKATWKWQKGREGFDKKSMADQCPHLYETFVTTGKETRVLRLPKVVK